MKGLSYLMEISFTSGIKPATLQEFSKFIEKINSKNAVNYPWTIKESALAKDVYTRNICDCSACLITDGQKALLMHLSPALEVNHAFNQVLQFIRDSVDLKQPNLQAVLVGSKNNKKSLDIYNKFSELLNRLNIPFSEIKNGKTPTSIAYSSTTDEVLITNSTIDKMLKKGFTTQNTLDKSFEKYLITDCDEILA